LSTEPWQLVALALVGIVAGFVNVLAGGGSLVTVPVMVFMGIPGPVANGTNRIAVVSQSIAAIATFARSGLREFKLSLTLSACAIPGAIIGALVGTRWEGVWFNRALALTMVAIMLLMYFDRGAAKQAADYQPTRRQLAYGHLLMVGVGFWGGLIQVGVGFIIMPVLNRVMGLDLVRTNALKVFIIGAYSIVALLVFASQLQLLWLIGIALAIGYAIGGWLGAHFTMKAGERLIRIVMYVVLGVFVIKLLIAS
jgi:uncharacterized membrane protein YfcA